MSRTGLMLLVAGVLVAGLATIQFFLPVNPGMDPEPNPFANAMLTWFGWVLGGLLAMIGLILLGSGRFSNRRPPPAI